MHPLKKYRTEHHLTLEALAARVKSTAATLSRIEARKHSPSMALLGLLAKETGLSADAFLPLDEAKPRRRARRAA